MIYKFFTKEASATCENKFAGGAITQNQQLVE